MSDKPEFTLRDGAIKATTWRHQSQSGDFLNTNFSRTYKDEATGELRDTNSFSGADLLKVAALAQESWRRSLALKHQKRNEQEQGQVRARSRDRSGGRER